MKKIIITLCMLTSLFLSLSAIANHALLPCSSAPPLCSGVVFSDVKQQIHSHNPKFKWNSPSCQIIGTKSLFPKKAKDGVVHYEKGSGSFCLSG